MDSGRGPLALSTAGASGEQAKPTDQQNHRARLGGCDRSERDVVDVADAIAVVGDLERLRSKAAGDGERVAVAEQDVVERESGDAAGEIDGFELVVVYNRKRRSRGECAGQRERERHGRIETYNAGYVEPVIGR